MGMRMGIVIGLLRFMLGRIEEEREFMLFLCFLFFFSFTKEITGHGWHYWLVGAFGTGLVPSCLAFFLPVYFFYFSVFFYSIKILWALLLCLLRGAGGIGEETRER